MLRYGVDTATKFRYYDNIPESTRTDGNSRSGHHRRISTRLTLTLYLVYGVLVPSKGLGNSRCQHHHGISILL